jgi:hypothetical protein
MNFQIDWGNPRKVKLPNGSIAWRREWSIPSNFLNPFFDYWRRNKMSMRNIGYGVYKKDSTWMFTETKMSCNQFTDILGKDKQEKKEEPVFVLPFHTVRNSDGLRPWQVASVSKLVASIEHWGGAIDGSDLGTGKSYCACAVAREMDYNIAVVCPKQVITTWSRVIKNHFKMGDKLAGIINYESLRTGKKESPIASIIWDKKNRRNNFTWKVPKNTLIVWDEAQKLKNWKTKNSKTCLAAKKQGFKMLFCSATMAVNPMDVRTIGTCMGMFKNAGDYYEWLYDHGVSKGRFGLEFNNDESALKRLHKQLFEQRGTRLTRDEIPGFPESEIIAEPYNMEEEDTKQINSIFEEMRNELALIERKEKKETSRMGIETRARQKVEMLKIPLFVEMVEDGIEQGMSVVIFVNYTETVHALASRLNTKCIYNGEDTSTRMVRVAGEDMKMAVRDINVDLFQANKEKVIIVNLASGGAGLSLHDLHGGHPRLAIISPSYDARHFYQSLGRVWRDGAKTKSLQRLVYIAGTIEESICRNIQQKLKNIELINDNDLSGYTEIIPAAAA